MPYGDPKPYSLAIMEEDDILSIPTIAIKSPRDRSSWLPRLTSQDTDRRFIEAPQLQSIHERSCSSLEPRCSESATPITDRALMYRKSWIKVGNEGNVSEYSADEPLGPDVVYYDALKEYRADNDRAWHIDWMRFVANWLVVAVHIIESVTNLNLWATAPEHSTMRSFLVNLLQIGMPIFFYASGRAAAYSSDRNMIKFALKKTKRLLVPLIFGYLLIVMLSAFISGPFYACRASDMPRRNIFKFMGWFYSHFGNCGFEWLWFLPSLWGLSIGSFPLTLFVQTWQVVYSPPHCLSEKDRRLKARLLRSASPSNVEKLKAMQNSSLLFSLYTASIIIILFGFFLPLLGLPGTHILLYCLPFLLAALVPTLIAPFCRKINWRLPLFIWLPAGTIWLAAIREKTVNAIEDKGTIDDFVAREMTSMAFYACFYLQGFIEQRYMFEWERYERLAMESGGVAAINFLTRPFKVIIWVALMANGMPGLSEHWAYLWTYPVYNEVYASVSYVLGSWIGLHFWERFMMMYCRSSFGQLYHKHVTQSSMVVYIVHGLSIAVVGRAVVYPFHETLRRISGVLIYSLLVPPITFLLYFIIINVPPLASGFSVGDGNWAWSEWGRPGREVWYWLKGREKQDQNIELKASEGGSGCSSSRSNNSIVRRKNAGGAR